MDKPIIPGGTSTTSKLATVLELLADGRWHMLEDVQQQVKIDGVQLQRITDFLKEYDFIERDEAEKKIKLNKMAQRFLAQTTTA